MIVSEISRFMDEYVAYTGWPKK